MDIITTENLRELTLLPGGMSVSIYLPTTPIGREARQGPISLKNLLREAEQKLTEGGLRGPEAMDLLAPAESLLTDDEFWGHQSSGLALFLSTAGIRYYRLPQHFEEL